MIVGVPIGFVAWVIGSFAVLAATGTLAGTTGGNDARRSSCWCCCSWRRSASSCGERTRRLAQGFVLGAAIGLVVAGGLCIPLVTSF